MNKTSNQSNKCPKCGIVLNRQYIRCPNCGHTSFQSYISLVVTLSFILCFGPIWFYLNLQSGDFGWIILVVSTLISIFGGFAIYRTYTVLRLPSLQKMQKRKDITGLIRMVSHQESEIRKAAILALGEFRDERAIGALISALNNDVVRAGAVSTSLIKIGTPSEEPLIAIINRASTLKEVGHPSVLSGEKRVPVYALDVLEKIGGVSAIKPIINLASTNKSYSNRAIESLKNILKRNIIDISVEDLKMISNLHGIIGVIGDQPIRNGSADDDWLREPIYGLLELELQMPQLRLIAMQELKRRNIEIR